MSKPLPPDERDVAVFREVDDGQLQLLKPGEGDGLEFGTWVENMPTDDQYRLVHWVA